MRGCVTLLTFIAMLALPFVVLGYSIGAFVAMTIIFSALWLMTKGAEKVSDALARDDEEKENDTEHN